jgi:hypothetical protein
MFEPEHQYACDVYEQFAGADGTDALHTHEALYVPELVFVAPQLFPDEVYEQA